MVMRRVNCPVCGTPSPFDPGNAHRPFCSERCKLIDLGQWATESYRVPAEDEAGPANTPSQPDQ